MNKIKKIIFITTGMIAIILGSIGALIPILPTTPFLLLASFCFVKGSDKFDRWFKETKIYKKYLKSYVEKKAITMKKKISILLVSDTMIAFPLITSTKLYVKILLLTLVIIKCYYVIFKINTINVE